jgi:hypothetical protein
LNPVGEKGIPILPPVKMQDRFVLFCFDVRWDGWVFVNGHKQVNGNE